MADSTTPPSEGLTDLGAKRVGSGRSGETCELPDFKDQARPSAVEKPIHPGAVKAGANYERGPEFKDQVRQAQVDGEARRARKDVPGADLKDVHVVHEDRDPNFKDQAREMFADQVNPSTRRGPDEGASPASDRSDNGPHILDETEESTEVQLTLEIPQAYLVEETLLSSKSRISRKTFRTILVSFAVAMVVVASIVAGVCASGKCAPSTTSTLAAPERDDNVLIAVSFQSSPDELVTYADAQLKLVNDVFESASGSVGTIVCNLLPCLEKDSTCNDGLWIPGCCFVANCTSEVGQCGNKCPDLPLGLPCHQVDPTNEKCRNAGCYTCDKVNGEDIFKLTEFVFQISCLSGGTAVRQENLESYEWAILCGPVSAGEQPELNFDQGEYSCVAFREGAGYSYTDGGVGGTFIPCHFIQLGECGCGPADVFPFGLPPPNKTCASAADCRFLCNDAGPRLANTICDAFDGIEWWEGQNFMEADLFAGNTIEAGRGAGELDIYLR